MATWMGQNKRGKKKKFGVIAVPSVVVAVAIAVVAAILLGRLSVSLKQPNQVVVLRTVVCSDDTINKYNDILKATGQASYDADYAQLAKDIEAKSDFSSDTNCVFMLFNYYAYKNDGDKSVQYASRYEELTKSGQFVSGAIVNPVSTTSAANRAQSIKSPNGNPAVEGRG